MFDLNYETPSYINNQDITKVSKINKQKLNPQRLNSGKNIISMTSSITNTDDIDRQIEELIEKVGVKQYQCKPCGKISNYTSHAKDHAETHIEGLSFNCDMCDKTFRTRCSYRKHITQRCPMRTVE